MSGSTIFIDGSQGEGGGQVLRTSLTLSLATARPFRMENIRAGRKKPGLLRQHLTSVMAAAEVGQAEVDGAELRSGRLEFRPGEITPGDYHFSVGTAGSACLVLQTILPPLCTAGGPSKLTVDGGTHNPFAPTFHYLERVYLPRIARMGPRLTANLHRYGFYPAGGGSFTLEIEPVRTLEQIELMTRGETTARRAAAFVAHIPDRIGERELRLVRLKLGWSDEECEVVRVTNSKGPGNILSLTLCAGDETEVVTAFGEVRLRAEAVAQKAVDQMRRFVRTNVPVGHHLADQLLVPMALAGGGAFRTLPLSRHTRTNIDVIRRFLDVRIDVVEEERGAVRVTVTC